jgi:hypothetical protein
MQVGVFDTIGGITMSDKAETKQCHACLGRGYAQFYPRKTCEICSGTGVRTTGVVVGRLEPNPVPYIKPALGHGASGLPLDPLSGLRPDERNVTIAEQSAEIERLKMERDTHLCPLCHGTGRVGNVNDREACERCEGSGIDAYTEKIAELTTDRDTLRLEVQKLKDLNFEAQDRYAALEAERDEARRASETVHSHYVLALKQRDEAVANTRAECDKGYEALFQAHQRMVAERDELKRERAERMSALEAAMRTIAAQNAQVRAMNEQLDAVTQLIVQRMENSTHE